MKTIKFGEVEIGLGQPPYIIAEVVSNHNGNMDLCRRLIDAAAAAGAHAVKFQSWTDTSLIAEEEYARNTVPVQPVNATLFNTLIRQCFSGRTHSFGRT